MPAAQNSSMAKPATVRWEAGNSSQAMMKPVSRIPCMECQKPHNSKPIEFINTLLN